MCFTNAFRLSHFWLPRLSGQLISGFPSRLLTALPAVIMNLGDTVKVISVWFYAGPWFISELCLLHLDYLKCLHLSCVELKYPSAVALSFSFLEHRAPRKEVIYLWRPRFPRQPQNEAIYSGGQHFRDTAESRPVQPEVPGTSRLITSPYLSIFWRVLASLETRRNLEQWACLLGDHWKLA